MRIVSHQHNCEYSFCRVKRRYYLSTCISLTSASGKDDNVGSELGCVENGSHCINAVK